MQGAGRCVGSVAGVQMCGSGYLPSFFPGWIASHTDVTTLSHTCKTLSH